ncbi:MAG TPA: NAD-dependent epimerase/dehydratase family protein, partial [Myxococcota bacterium]
TLTAAFRRFGVDRVVHLVARVDPPRDAADREAMRRLHLDGTRAVVDAASAVDVDHVVLVSSAVVYGAHADNTRPLPVDAPLRPNPFPYAEDKAAQEALVRGLVEDDRLTVVRPAIVYAAHAHNYLTEIIRRARLPFVRGVLPALDGHRPPLQFVHVDDVAAIVAAALSKRVTGTLHAASNDALTYDEVAAIAGLRVVDVPLRLIGPVLDRLVPLMPPSLRAPSALFPYLMFPFLIDMASTSMALQLTPSWSSADTLRAMLDGR